MKYLKLYQTDEQYQQEKNYLDFPNVTYVQDINKVYYNKDIPDNMIQYKANAKLTGFTSTNFTETVSSHEFSNGVGLITFSEDLTSIGQTAFSDCTNLISITIPKKVESIKQSSFKDCSNLTQIVLNNGITNISAYAFNGSGLESVFIPSSITTLGTNIFLNCTNLLSIKVSPSNIIFDSRDNCNAIIETSSNTIISGCKNTIIPSTVTTIGNRAFFGNSLTSITIPSSVTTIDSYAFSNCENLESVTVSATTPPTLGSNAFRNASANIKIYVPSESVNTYKAASGWSTYTDYIQAIS